VAFPFLLRFLFHCVFLGFSVSEEVYQCRLTALPGRLIVVKVLDNFSSDSVIEKMKIFMHQSKHANLLTCFGFKEANQRLYLISEYCDARSLLHLVANSPDIIKEIDLAYVCRAILRALAYLHSNQIFHLAVKSSNIFVTRRGAVKLDFSSFGSNNMSNTKSSEIGEEYKFPVDLEPHPNANRSWPRHFRRLSSSSCMAPETLVGCTTPSSAIDIWALGVTVTMIIEYLTIRESSF
jgi:serine/threonine protein kinase